jgi:hypothetical protein
VNAIRNLWCRLFGHRFEPYGHSTTQDPEVVTLHSECARCGETEHRAVRVGVDGDRKQKPPGGEP